MKMHVVRWVSCVALCGGAACVVVGDGSVLCPNVPLDRASGTITITQEVGTNLAGVTASLLHGSCVETLEGGQEIAVSGQTLSGPDAAGHYAASLASNGDATAFVVLVNEPTRGVSETDINLPGTFDVTSPAGGGALSLSGTTFTWTNPDPTLKVTITIRQNLFGPQITRSYGPFDDTGSRSLSVTDLSAFAQGADLTIVVKKTRQQNVINGLQSGTLTAELTRTITVTPVP